MHKHHLYYTQGSAFAYTIGKGKKSIVREDPLHCRLLSSLAPKSIEFVWMEIDKKGPTLYLLNLQCVHCARCTHAEVKEMFSFVWYKNIKKAPARFELTISCLLDRRFNQLSHGAMLFYTIFFFKYQVTNWYA